MNRERIDQSAVSRLGEFITAAPPPPILETTFKNPAHDTPDGWAGALCSNTTFPKDDPPHYEWTQVLDPGREYESDLVGLSGAAMVLQAGTANAGDGLSGSDVWFTHPFGFDWEFFVAPDPQYLSILAPSNSSTDGEYGDAIAHAKVLGLDASSGVLGVETDQDLVPPAYRAVDGDRVAVFGRWIVDCGHSDFHTEIHPPLLIAAARPQHVTEPDGSSGPLDATYCSLVARPYLVSQEFGDGALRNHLLHEISKAEIPFIPFAGSLHIEAHPQIAPKPFDGIYLIPLTVRPPSQRTSPSDRLVVTYQFTLRPGVVVQVMAGDGDSVNLLVEMNSVQYSAPALPPKHDWNIGIGEIHDANSDAGDLVDAIAIINALLDPLADAVLARGILTDRYDAPDPTDPHDGESTRVYVDQVSGNSTVSIDDQQPFPLRGWLLVEWERHSDLVPAGTTIGAARVARQATG